MNNFFATFNLGKIANRHVEKEKTLAVFLKIKFASEASILFLSTKRGPKGRAAFFNR